MILAPRDHGGNLEQARATYGGDDWIDLSTGINRVPYPMPAISPAAFATLPTQAAMAALLKVAAVAYGTSAPMMALSGAQAAIQLVPHLRPTGLARVVGPTYNEHAATLRAWATAREGERIALVSHGTFLDALIKALFGQDFASQLYYTHYNTAISRIDFTPKGFLLLRYLNRTEHLSPELITR